MTNTQEIARLNDEFRTNPSKGVLVLTQGIRCNTQEDIATIINKVRNFNDFNEDNNPYGEKIFFPLNSKAPKSFSPYGLLSSLKSLKLRTLFIMVAISSLLLHLIPWVKTRTHEKDLF